MARGLSSLVISIVMLAIVVPIGVILVERSRESLEAQPSVEAPALLRIYGVANGSSWLLIMINHGYVDAMVSGVVLSNGSWVGLGVLVSAHSLRAASIASDSRPSYAVINSSPEAVSIEVIG